MAGDSSSSTSLANLYLHLQTLIKKWVYDKTEVDNKLINKENTSNKVTSLSSSSTDTQYPSAKAVFNSLPSVPSASTTTPSADTTNGSVGTGTTWARSNHSHPKSSLYATANHTHYLENLGTTSGYNVIENVQNFITDYMIKYPDGTSIGGPGYVIGGKFCYVEYEDRVFTIGEDNKIYDVVSSKDLEGKLSSSDVVDNLTTNDATKVLSAKQGKVLNDKIGDAITYITQ